MILGETLQAIAAEELSGPGDHLRGGAPAGAGHQHTGGIRGTASRTARAPSERAARCTLGVGERKGVEGLIEAQRHRRDDSGALEPEV